MVKIVEKYQGYKEEIPEEVRIAIRSLCNDVRQGILVLLSSGIELAFSDIQKKLEIDKMKLNFHLKNLFSSGLIDHYYRHEVGNPKYSYYSISQLGKRILTYLIHAFIPPFPITEYKEPESYIQKFDVDKELSESPDELFCYLKEKANCLVTNDPSGTKVAFYQSKISESGPGRYARIEEQGI